MLGLFKGSGKKGRKGKGSGAAADDDLPFALDDGPDEVPAGADAKAGKKGGGGLLGGLLGGKGKAADGKTGGGKAGGGKGKGKKAKAAPEADPFDNPAVLALIASEVSSLPPPEDVPEEEQVLRAPEPDIDGARHNRPGVMLEDAPPPPEPPFDDDDDMPPGFDDLDEDEDSKPRGRKAVIAAVAAVVVLAAAGGGAWWALKGTAGPGGDVGMQEAAAPGQAPDEGPAAPQSGKTISMTMPTAVTPQGVEPAPGTDGRSLSHRPWLAETTPAAPTAGGTEPPATPAKGAPAENVPTDGAPTDTAKGEAPADSKAPTQTAEQTPAAKTPAAKTGDAAPDPAAPEPASPATEAPAAPPAPASVPPEQRLADAPKNDLPPLKEPVFPAEPADQHVVPAFSRLPTPKEPPVALAKAPVPAVARTTPTGILPVIGAQGETPWKTYARPFKGLNGAPRIAVVITGLGLDPEATDAAITRLPPDVTLSFSPYAPKLAEQVAKARAGGHEVMLDLPLEGDDFPNQDPGPLGMLSVLPQVENITRLETVMGKATGYTGFVGLPGAKFGGSRAHMRTVLEQLAARGLVYIHTGPKSGLAGADGLKLPLRQAVIDVDARPFREAIDARLAWLEEVAKVRSSTVAVLSPLPVSFERLSRWVGELNRKGLTLAPASAVMSDTTS